MRALAVVAASLAVTATASAASPQLVERGRQLYERGCASCHGPGGEGNAAVGPARGALGLPLDRIVVVHDEIDLPFGEIRVRLGGGLAGHNGLRSLKRELGGADFHRVRVGVGRPDSTDPDIVAAYVLGRWRQPAAEVSDLVDRAAAEAERLVLGG